MLSGLLGKMEELDNITISFYSFHLMFDFIVWPVILQIGQFSFYIESAYKTSPIQLYGPTFKKHKDLASTKTKLNQTYNNHANDIFILFIIIIFFIQFHVVLPYRLLTSKSIAHCVTKEFNKILQTLLKRIDFFLFFSTISCN